jgi:hypothetical protein
MRDKWDTRSLSGAQPEPSKDTPRLDPVTSDVDEIQRLMKGFAGELRKLEEGLRILSAYVTRMRSRSESDEERTLH